MDGILKVEDGKMPHLLLLLNKPNPPVNETIAIDRESWRGRERREGPDRKQQERRDQQLEELNQLD